MFRKYGFRTFLALSLSVVLILTSVLTGGCAREPSIIQGWVSAEAPVFGAKLTVYTIEGKQIFQSDKATGNLGSFIIAVNDLPSNFRIVASGGSQGGQPYQADLSADVRGYDANPQVVYINPVTTMVSAYIDVNPSKTFSAATTAVKKFLAIPDFVDIGKPLPASGQYFSYSKFNTEANANGGTANFIKKLAADMGSPAATHSFAGTGLVGGMLGGVGGFIAENLAKGAVSYVGGQLLGWGLSELGLGFPDKTKEELDQIKKQLEQMQAQMNQMQQQLTQISQQLDHLQSQMADMENKLSTQISQTDYDVRVGQIIKLMTNIFTIRDKITNYVSDPPADPDVLNYTRAKIMKLIEDNLIGNEDVIHYQLVGIGMATPLLKLWSQIVKGHNRFLTSVDSADVQSQFDYFDTIQLWYAEIMVEYYHSKACEQKTDSPMYNMYTGDAKAAIDKYNSHLADQQKLLLPSIPDGAVWDRTQDLLFRNELLLTNSLGIRTMYIDSLPKNPERPPGTFNNLPYDMYYPAWYDKVFNLFNKSGTNNPYQYAISQGWPKDKLNPLMNVGTLGGYNSDGSKIQVLSLMDGKVTVADFIKDKDNMYYWVLQSSTYVTDPKTQNDTHVVFFW